MYEFLVKTLPRLLPAVCLMSFLIFEAVWMSILVATFCFAYLYLVQVFVEQSQQWHTSPYLYVTILSLVLTWAEYQYGILAGLLQ